jgi:hypothetical protein
MRPVVSRVLCRICVRFLSQSCCYQILGFRRHCPGKARSVPRSWDAKKGTIAKKLQPSSLPSGLVLGTRGGRCALCGGGGKSGLRPGPHSL